MSMDIDLHACRREANQNSVTMPELKKTCSDVLGPKLASGTISEHQKISRGSMPPHPLVSVRMPNVHTRARVQVLVSQTNGVLLPLGLVYGHVTWCLYFVCTHVCAEFSLCFVFRTHVLVVAVFVVYYTVL